MMLYKAKATYFDVLSLHLFVKFEEKNENILVTTDRWADILMWNSMNTKQRRGVRSWYVNIK
jgi:hypothetical protein